MGKIKLWSVSDSPPTLAVRMAMKYLDIDYELVNLDYAVGDTLKPDYQAKSPQAEVPLIDDNGFVLSESTAIMQYLADSYPKDSTFYPKSVKERAIVNHRLAFHLSTYYKCVLEHMMLPIFFDFERTADTLKRMNHCLKTFDEILKRQNTLYSAGNNLTIADMSLVMSTVCLEAINFDFSPFPMVKAWYGNFKKNHADIWALADMGLQELVMYAKNPPDLSHLTHPLYPIRKK